MNLIHRKDLIIVLLPRLLSIQIYHRPLSWNNGIDPEILKANLSKLVERETIPGNNLSRHFWK